MPELTIHCRIHFVEPRARLVVHRSSAEARGIINVAWAKRELQALMQRKYLWVDETARLKELAAMLGLQVQMQRHHLANSDAEAFVLP